MSTSSQTSQPIPERLLSTSKVSIDIACPVWCAVPALEHAAELWNAGGVCIHHSETTKVIDRGGYHEPMKEPRFYGPVEVFITAETRPDDGAETASPVVHVDGTELSMQQALDLANSLTGLVETYRAAGGLS